MRQKIEFQKSRALVQSLLAQKDAEEKVIKEVFDQLKEAYFPFDRNTKAEESSKWRNQLMKEINRGVLSVTPLEDMTRKSVKARLKQGQKEQAKRLSMTEEGKLTQLDPVEKARRRPRGTAF
jgi:hypothetical protein